MLVRIIKRTFSGAEYCPEQRVLKLGGENSAGVETLEFELPEEWEGLAVTVHVQHLDGTLPTPMLLGSDRCLTVGKAFTASEKGLWMLKAVGTDGYCALTRPTRYECYETFDTEGKAEITPSQYEQFVAQVLSAANDTANRAKEAADGAQKAAAAAREAGEARDSAAQSAQTAKEHAADAANDAGRAEAAAKRAEDIAPADGAVLSVNGKGGAVKLTAADVGALPEDSADVVQSIELTGRTMTVTMLDGTKRSYTTQDTRSLEAMTGVLGTGHGGTGKTGALTAADVGAVEAGTDGYLKSVQVQGTALVTTTGSGKTESRTVLPPATAAALGGIKVGNNLSVASDGTLSASAPYSLTADKIAAALGYTPVSAAGAAQLPYSIVYDQSYVGTGTQQDYAGNGRTITLHGDYDAVGVITTNNSNYPVGTEKARQCVLKELVTLESPITAFCQNYITLKGLPTTSTAANKLNMTGLVVIYNQWADSSTSVSYKDRVLRLTDNTTTNNYGTYSWNNASYQYHVFGITLNSSILPVSDADMENAGGKV